MPGKAQDLTAVEAAVIQSVMLTIAILMLATIIILMIKKKSNASISLIWIGFSLISLFIGIFPRSLSALCSFIGIEYPPILAVVIAVACLFAITFYISSELAVAQNKIRELSIQISLLNDEMHRLKQTNSTEDL